MNSFRKDLIIGWRNILKNKLFSFLNIGSVALSVAVSCLILFWVVDELSFDKFHDNLDRIYTVYEHQVYSDGQDLHTSCTPFPLSQHLKSTYPQIEKATTFNNFGNQTVKRNTKEYKNLTFCTADEQFLEVFSFKVIEGESDALTKPDHIIISQKVAQLFFGNSSPIGEKLELYGKYELTVGGVIENINRNSTIQFDVLGSVKGLTNWGVNLSNWGNNWPRTSVLLAENTNIESLESEITNICKDKGQDNTSLHLFPQKKERLYSYNGKNERIQYIYQFLAVALIIILISSINFINASTASSETRLQEVGVRKSLGASRLGLIKQFIAEKGLMIGISIFFSMQLVFVLSPLFNQVSGKSVSLDLLQNKYMIIGTVALIIITLILSVSYPALYVSSFKPAQVLKSSAVQLKGKLSLRSILVVVQFSLSIILIICTISVTRQLKYITNYDLGYNKDNLVYINLDDATKTKHEALKTQFTSIPGVVNIAKADKLPLWGGNSSWGYEWQGKDPEKKVLICLMQVDENYFETLGIPLTEGRSFSSSVKSNKQENNGPVEVILNEEAIRRAGIKDPIGKFFGRSNWKSSIVGITNDFHFESLKTGVEPMIITPLNSDPNVLILRINPQNFTETLGIIKTNWAEIIPDSKCEIGFFDRSLENMYTSESRISGLFKYFSFVAIFIACVGLLGLSFYAIERKKKEIGIRKVNGSTISQVLVMLNLNFIKCVGLSFIIACPIAYYTMSKWLENFAYKTELSWWIFASAGLLALGIAIITVSWQSWRAATRNPVEALRYE